jgi:hypothetical protein
MRDASPGFQGDRPGSPGFQLAEHQGFATRHRVILGDARVSVGADAVGGFRSEGPFHAYTGRAGLVVGASAVGHRVAAGRAHRLRRLDAAAPVSRGATGVVVAASACIRFSTEIERDNEETLILIAAAGRHDHHAVLLALIEEEEERWRRR